MIVIRQIWLTFGLDEFLFCNMRNQIYELLLGTKPSYQISINLTCNQMMYPVCQVLGVFIIEIEIYLFTA